MITILGLNQISNPSQRNPVVVSISAQLPRPNLRPSPASAALHVRVTVTLERSVTDVKYIAKGTADQGVDCFKR